MKTESIEQKEQMAIKNTWQIRIAGILEFFHANQANRTIMYLLLSLVIM